MKRQSIVDLAIDLAKGKVVNYSAEEGGEVLRKALAELAGYSLDSGKIDRKVFRRNKIEIFEIIEEVLNETIEQGLRSQFDGFAEYRNLAWGDTNLFKVPANDIFRVAMVSDGNSNIRRQRLRDGEDFQVSMDTYAVKIGEDFLRLLAGRVDMQRMVNLIAESFKRDLTQRVYDAVYASYGKYNGTYHKTMTKASLTEDMLVEMAMHIEARTGESVAIYGTKMALRAVAPSKTTQNMDDSRNKLGYYGEVAGIELREIKQSHKFGKDEFAIDNGFLLILPQSVDKMVKVVNEGDAIIQDQKGGQTADMMEEYFISNKFGVSVICSKVFGIIRLT